MRFFFFSINKDGSGGINLHSLENIFLHGCIDGGCPKNNIKVEWYIQIYFLLPNNRNKYKNKLIKSRYNESAPKIAVFCISDAEDALIACIAFNF